MSDVAVLQLELDSKKYKRELKNTDVQTTRNTKSMSKAFSTMSTIAIAAMAGIAAKLAIDSVKAYAVQEDALDDLSAALKQTGDDVESLVPRYASFAAEIQKTTIYGDELLLSQMAYGKNLGITTDKLEDATKAAVGLAAKYKIGLQTAMQLVGRAALGQTQMLTRYGIVLKEGSTDQEKFNQLLEIGAGSFTLAEAKAKTTSGQIKQLSNTWGDMQEEVGEFLVDGVQLNSVLKDIAEGIKGVTTPAKILTTYIGATKDALVGLGAKAFTYFGTMSKVAKLEFEISKLSTRSGKARSNLTGGERVRLKSLKSQLDWQNKINRSMQDSINDQTVSKLDTQSKSLETFLNKTPNMINKIGDSTSENLEKIKKAIGDGFGADLGLTGLTDPKKYLEDLKNFELGISGLDSKDKRTSSLVQQDPAQAILKGSMEAIKLEQSSQGSKIEQKQYKETKKQTDYLKTIANKDTVETLS